MTFFAFLGGLRRRWTGSRRRGKGRSPARAARQPKRALFQLEALEDRNLMAVLPPAVALPPAVISGGNSPALAVDPTNPQKMVLAYSTQVTVYGQSMYATGIHFTVDGGANWRTHTWGNDPLNNNAPITVIPNLPDPTKTPDFGGADWGAYTGFSQLMPPFFTSMNPQGMVPGSGTFSTRQQPYDVASAPSITIDRNGNVYLVRTEHSTDQRSGAVVFDSFLFTTNDLATNQTSKVIYRWVNGDPAYNAVVGVNNNLASYQDPDGTGNQFLQTDPTTPAARAVYVAWNTNVGAYNGAANGSQNSSQIKLAVTTDHGASFTTETYVNTHSNYSLDNPGGGGSRGGVMSNSAAPQIAFTHPRANGTEGGDLVFVWNGSTSDNSGNNNIVTTVSTPDPDTAPVVYTSAVGAGGTVRQAIKGPDGTTPRVDTPVATDYSITVNITDPNFDFLTDLDVTLSFATANLDEYRVQLIAPDGTTTVTLIRNRINNRGDDAGGGVGFAAGTRLGAFWYPIPGTDPVQYFYAAPGTTFDSEAQRGVTDTSVANAAPYIGHFRPEAGSLRTQFYNGNDRWTPNGTGGLRRLNGTWTLRVTDNRWNDDGTNPPPPRLLNYWQMKMTSRLYNGSTWGGTVPSFGTNSVAANNTVSFSAGTQNAYASVANSLGVAPAPVVAVDTTLGAYSPYQGRMYIAYVGAGTAYNTSLNYADNSDIFILRSTNGGRSWSGSTRVNDDSIFDNITEGNRPQWQPTLAVDPVTGTVVVTYYDARNDASRSRSVITLATSIDGGQTFTDAGTATNRQRISSQTPLTQWKTAYDPVTRTTVRLEPVPINASAVPGTDGIGSQGALAVYGGRIVSVWSGNFNANAAQITSARATIAAGPRVVESDMGPITAPFTAGGIPYNSIVAPDGTRLFDGFLVTFDRPIDPTTFTPSDVTLVYRSPTTLASDPGADISNQVWEITPLDLGAYGTPGGAVAGRELATEFLVRVRPQSGVGTYSYVIGPNIQDKVRSGVFTPGAGSPITPVFSAGTTIPGHPRATATFTVGAPTNDLSGSTGFQNVSVTVSITGRPFGSTLANTRLTLIGPGGQTVLLYDTNDPTIGPLQNLVGQTFSNVALPSGDPTGDWRLQFDDFGGTGGGTLAWNNLTFTPTYPQQVYANNNPANVQAGFVTQSNIVVPINLPGTYVSSQGLQVQVSLNMNGTNTLNNIQTQLATIFGGINRTVNLTDYPPNALTTGSQLLGTVFDDLAATIITDPANLPPYPFTYRPVQAFGGVLDPLAIPLAGPRTWTLNVGNSSAFTGTLARWEIRITPQHDAVVLTNQSVAIPTINVVNSQIAVTQPAGTLLAHPVVSLNIQYPQPPGAGAPPWDLSSLQADLIGPTGLTVRLFNAGDIQGQTLPGIVLDDTAAASIVGTGPAYAVGSRFSPRNLLSAFDGTNPTGTWTLRVQDTLGQAFDGTLGWSLSFVPVPQTAFSSVNRTTIPVGGTGNSSLTVAGAASIQHVAVTANVSFPNIDNVRLVLTPPAGSGVAPIQLLPAQTGLTGRYLSFTTFDDYGRAAVNTGTAPYTGVFLPDSPLTGLVGKTANGTWTLSATDAVGNTLTGGFIVRWSLAFTPPALEGNLMDQNQNAITAENGPGAYDSWAIPRSLDTTARRGVSVVNDPFSFPFFDPAPWYYQVQVPQQMPGTVITNVRVTVNSFGTPLNQLELYLRGPNGTLVQLFNRHAPGNNNNFLLNTIFDDRANNILANGVGPFTGPFKPDQPLSVFNGTDPTGIWELVVPDGFGDYEEFSDVLGETWKLDLETRLVPRPLSLPFASDTLPLLVPGPRLTGTGGLSTEQPKSIVAGNSILSTVSLPGGVGTVANPTVTVNLTHPAVGDLTLTLIAPNGDQVVLSQRRGGALANMSNLQFADAAALSVANLGAGTAPFTGVFQAEGLLSTFNTVFQGGQTLARDAGGTWTLRIDNAGTQTGTLNGWSFNFGGTQLASGDNLVLNGSASTMDVVFDHDMDPATFTPDKILRMVGPAGEIKGPFTITPNPAGTAPELARRLFRIGFTEQKLSGSYVITLDSSIKSLGSTSSSINPGSQVPDVAKAIQQGSTVASTFTVPASVSGLVSDLTVAVNITNLAGLQLNNLVLSLVGPDGTTVQLMNANGGTNTALNNVRFTDKASLGIGSVPSGLGTVIGLFKPAQALSAFNGKAIAGAWTLRVQAGGAGGAVLGTLNGWTLDFGPTTYSGIALDTNTNAGYDAQRGTNSTGVTAPVTFNAGVGNVNLPIDPGTTVLSTITVNDPFVIQGATLTLNITGTQNQFLRAELIGPDGTVVNLFDSLAAGALGVIGVTFDDAALIPIDNLAGPYNSGPYNPKTPLSDLRLKNAQGTYTLRLRYGAGAFSPGTLTAWSLTLKKPVTAVLAGQNRNVQSMTPGSTATSTIQVTDSFAIQGVVVTLNVSNTEDKFVTGTLTGPDGTVMTLFSNPGTGSVQTLYGFANTTLDDAATTDIQSALPPFNIGPYKPLNPLSVFKGRNSAGTWTLRLTYAGSASRVGQLNSWQLSLFRPDLGTGLGELVADQTTANFRIFTMDQTNTVSFDNWTAVGPAAHGSGNAYSSRTTGLAIDPSDPSGNTVFIGAASGGVWKTTNFLTQDPMGPTWVPLTDFGQSGTINIGGLYVFGRNNDPRQSVVFAVTGEGDTGSGGVGLLRSLDGGVTWELLDSTNNYSYPNPIGAPYANGVRLPFAQRDKAFIGKTSFKVVADPTPRTNGFLTVYAVFGGANGGVYQSDDSGNTWTLLRAGNATDLVLAEGSAQANTNYQRQILYAAFRGEGVYISTNRGQPGSWELMDGTQPNQTNMFDADVPSRPFISVTNATTTPNGAKGRISLATPALTGDPLKDQYYQDWLYALVSTTSDNFDGLYLTKDRGAHWTKVNIPIRAASAIEGFPTNNESLPDHNPFGGTPAGTSGFAQGNYDQALAIDPQNPNVVYIGGTNNGTLAPPQGFIRVDTTGVTDSHSLYPYNNNNSGGGIQTATTGGITLKGGAWGLVNGNHQGQAYINLMRDPDNPFVAGTSLNITGVSALQNNGNDIKVWQAFDREDILGGSTDIHRFLTFVDPSGYTRIIVADDHGVFSGVDKGNGNLVTSIGTLDLPKGTRNGNLQTVQMYGGAAQPSQAAADIAGALFYAEDQDTGFPRSDPNLLQNGNIQWSAALGDGSWVLTDQTGSGTVYEYRWACCGGLNTGTDFFIVSPNGSNPTGRMGVSGSSLFLPTDQVKLGVGQWPFLGGTRFAVNPIDNRGILMGGVNQGAAQPGGIAAGYYLYLTTNQGNNWTKIGRPGDGVVAGGIQALAFGAPDIGQSGNLNNFIYAANGTGQVWMTRAGGSPWINISGTGAGAISGAVQTIVPNPARGKHDVYVVTSTGVFYMADSTVPNPQWVSLTPNNNLFNLPRTNPYSTNDGSTVYKWVSRGELTSLAVDWRSIVPVLYVGSDHGVFRSIDQGANWTVFPNMTQDGAGQDGGYLPHVGINRLELVLGDVNTVTGLPDQTTGPSILAAYTYGRGAFAIRVSNPGSVPGPAIVQLTATTNSVTVRFNGPVDPTTFKLSEIRILKDPNGIDILPTAVTDVSVPLANGENPHNLFRIDFPTQTKVGAYTIQIGPNLADFSGNKMNQLPDGVNGADPSDRYTGHFYLNTGTSQDGKLVPGVFGRDPNTGKVIGGVTNGSNGFNNVPSSSDPLANPYVVFPTTVNWANVMAADFNGDGATDVAGRIPSNGEWWVSLAGGGGSSSFSRWATWDPTITWSNVMLGDFNGDGRTDLAARNSANADWWVSISNGTGFGMTRWIEGGTGPGLWRPGWSNPAIGDFNQDGKDDVAGFDATTGTWWVSTSDGQKFQAPTNWSLQSQMPPGLTTLANVGALNIQGSVDANGNPIKADVAIRNTANNTWYGMISTQVNGVWQFLVSTLGSWTANQTYVNVGFGDFNGDGQQEIAGMNQTTNIWVVSTPVLSGTNWTIGGANTNFNWGTWTKTATWINVGFGDITGDGRDDIAGMTSGSNYWYVSESAGTTVPLVTPSLFGSWGAGATFVDGKVGKFNGPSQPAGIAGRNATTGTWTLQITPTVLPTSTNVVDVLTGDFNGDGSQDIAQRVATTGQWWVSLANSGTQSSFQTWGTPWNPATTWTNVRTGDFNGDGKMDILGQDGTTAAWTVALSSGTTFTSSVWIAGGTLPNQWKKAWTYPVVGDFNKDGAADLAGLEGSTGTWYVALSNGTNGFIQPAAWLTGAPWNGGYPWTNVTAANITGLTDANGRIAKSDIVLYYGPKTNSWALISDGTQFTQTFLGNWQPGATFTNIGWADFDGDGRDEIAGFLPATGAWTISKPVQAASGTNPWVFGTTIPVWGGWSTGTAWTNVSFGDFDGDNKVDILGMVAGNNTWYASQSLGMSALASPVYVGAFPATTTFGIVRVADFNGDGKVDVGGRDSSTGAWQVQTSNGTNLSMPSWVQWFPQTNTWTGMMSGDFNGDGLDDLVARSVQSGQWWVALSNGSQAYLTQPWASWSTIVTWVDTKVGDFNGDGLMDLAARNQGTADWSVAVSDGSSFLTSIWGSWTRGVAWADVQTTDINGDGVTDLIGRDPASGQWIQSTAVPTTRRFSTTNATRWLPANATWVTQLTGDFNGDGIQDTAGLISQGNQWWVSVSRLGGGSPTQTYWGASWPTDRVMQRLLVADFTGDGRTDVAGLDQNNQWWVLAANATGTGFLAASNWTPAGTTPGSTGTGWWPGVGWSNILTGDFNGDGKQDIAGMAAGFNNIWVLLANGGGNGFLPTSNWTPAGTTPGTTTFGWWPGVGWTNVGAGDFNGDGKTDIAGMVPGVNNIWVLLANGAGTSFQPTTLWTPAGTTPGATTFGWWPGVSWTNVRFADLNGDGKTDILGMAPGANNVWVLLANAAGTSFQPTTLWTPAGTTPGQSTFGWWSGITWSNVTTGDFNGDGRIDLMGMVAGVNNIWVLLNNSTSTGFQPTTLWTPAGTTPGQSGFGWWSGVNWGSNVRVGDFTGDGKADVLGFVPGFNNWWLLPANAAGTSFQPTTLRETWASSNNFSKTVAGDFNGDGKGDIAGLLGATGQWYVSLSDGTTYSNPVPWGAPWAAGTAWTSIVAGDFNGDGRTDLAGLSGTTWTVSVSTGSSFATGAWGTLPAGGTWSSVVVGDLNGDGRSDLASFDAASGGWWVLLANTTGTAFQGAAMWMQWSPTVAWTDVQLVRNV